jgi:hypothetical protein
MSDDIRPLSDDERAELEALRAEKAAREERERAARERAELEELRRQRDAVASQAQPQRQAPSRQAVASARAAEAAEDRRIREARERGARLMEPDDDLRMPVGQKLVLGVIALLVAIIVIMHFFVG